MKIKKFEVKPIVIRAYCEECDELLEQSRVMLLTNPPKYKYKCPKCGKEEVSADNYPTVSYEIIREVRSYDK